MNPWKVAGELVSPKNMTVGSNRPLLVWKAAFHLSPSLIRILLYPYYTLSLVKHVESLSLSISSGINGSGYLFFIVMLLSFR